MSVVDDELPTGLHVDRLNGAEARESDLSASFGRHEKEAARIAEKSAPEALRLRFEFHSVGGGEEGAVREHVLTFSHVKEHDVSGEIRREEDASGFVVRDEGLLEEILVVQKFAREAFEEASSGFALERNRTVHRHHGVGLGGDALAGFECDAKERIDLRKNFKAGHEK